MDHRAGMFPISRCLLRLSDSHQIRVLFPDTVKILETIIDILPLGDAMPLHPFTSFVINFNVSTLVHRDYKDKEVCIVFQFSNCEGGELVLVEPGLVIRMRNGDGVIFRSAEISHFNLDYTGERVSMVFHTDNSMDDWAKDRNSWIHNIYMRTLVNTDPDYDI